MTLSNQSGNQKNQKKKLKRKLTYIAIIVVAIVLVIIVIAINGNKKNRISTADALNTDGLLNVIEPDTNNSTTTGDDLEGSIFLQDTDPEITAVINKFFVAKSECDADTLNSIVETKTEFTEDALKQEGEFIEGYENISCYTVNGLVENTYLVYVYYEIKFLNIDTLAPSLINMYVYKDKDGSVYINQGEIDGALSTFIQETNNNSEVRKLITSVNTKLAEARKSDSDLDALYKMLVKGQLPNSSAESSLETVDETTTAPSSEAVSTKTDTVIDTTSTITE